jgi:hypothetical protein
MGFDLTEIVDTETDAPFGNGGLERLAACFMESLATLGIPAYGFGINDLFGLFNSSIKRSMTVTKRKGLISGCAITLLGLSNGPGRPARSRCTDVLKVVRTKVAHYNPMPLW